MSTTTSGNLKLTKPAYSDPANINVINADLDAIDTAVSALQDSISSGKFGITLLSAADDLDEAKLNGFYRWNALPTNAPDFLRTYSRMLVIGNNQKGTSAVCQQVVFTETTIYWRLYTGSPRVWTSWRSVAGTVVS